MNIPSPQLRDNMILLNANTSSSFVVIILFDFFYTEVTILELKHVHLFNLAPFVGVHTAFVCKYHHALQFTV